MLVAELPITPINNTHEVLFGHLLQIVEVISKDSNGLEAFDLATSSLDVFVG